jgi:hypothetical protein
MRRLHVATAVLGMFVFSAAQVSNDEIWLGGTRLTLNMPQADVLTNLSDQHTLQKINLEAGDPRASWLVVNKGGKPPAAGHRGIYQSEAEHRFEKVAREPERGR